MFKLFRILLIPVICKLCAGFEHFLSNMSGEVSKDNFAYHCANYEGTILLELTSMSGDCDLYVSQITQKPSYEPEANCLSSITCGVDSVIIPKSNYSPVQVVSVHCPLAHDNFSCSGFGFYPCSVVSYKHTSHPFCWFPKKGTKDQSFKRPVGIGIFGHPSHEACSYNLAFYRIDDSRDIFNFDPYKISLRTEMNKKLHEQSVESNVSENERKSFFWVFLRDAVLFLIEIIL